jgi:hypothetical protein
METTLQEAREHLGVETQRQWSDLAILRTTPALLGILSLITIWANTLAHHLDASVQGRCLVRKIQVDLQRCHSGGAPNFMGSFEFFNVRETSRRGGNSASAV